VDDVVPMSDGLLSTVRTEFEKPPEPARLLVFGFLKKEREKGEGGYGCVAAP